MFAEWKYSLQKPAFQQGGIIGQSWHWLHFEHQEILDRSMFYHFITGVEFD